MDDYPATSEEIGTRNRVAIAKVLADPWDYERGCLTSVAREMDARAARNHEVERQHRATSRDPSLQ